MTSSANNLKSSIRDWWATSPMTYGSEHGTSSYTHPDGRLEEVPFGSKRFFELADSTFISWNLPRHGTDGYFSNIFPFSDLQNKSVLEVGCGMGFMASLWAQHGANITAIDLNPVAVAMTKQRFKIFGLEGCIQEADGEQLPFADSSFDYVYSWGVLHHSPNIQASVGELLRVLKPGGKIGVMLYSRTSILARYLVNYVAGFLHCEREFLDDVALFSRYGDGYAQEGNWHTWPVTRKEIRRDIFCGFEHINIDTFGTDVPGLLGYFLPPALPALPQPLLNALAKRWGWSFWITAHKPGE